jgi:hypothetical protein
MKHGGIVHRSTMISPYGIEAVPLFNGWRAPPDLERE